MKVFVKGIYSTKAVALAIAAVGGVFANVYASFARQAGF